MKKKTALIGCVAIWSVTCALGETDKVNLISCPDCGQRVSCRALMCPSCGCRGEVIEKAANELLKKPNVKEPDRFLRADFGSRVEITRDGAVNYWLEMSDDSYGCYFDGLEFFMTDN